MSAHPEPLVGVIMGSSSDLEVMTPAVDVLAEFGVIHEVHVVSAHRSPMRMVDYAQQAAGRGLRVIIAGAGLSAALPGVVAAHTDLPVIGVPLTSRTSIAGGLDALLSIVQMPSGVPVATMAIGGSANAGLLAVRILALSDDDLRQRLEEHQRGLERHALDQDAGLPR